MKIIIAIAAAVAVAGVAGVIIAKAKKEPEKLTRAYIGEGFARLKEKFGCGCCKHEGEIPDDGGLYSGNDF